MTILNVDVNFLVPKRNSSRDTLVRRACCGRAHASKTRREDGPRGPPAAVQPERRGRKSVGAPSARVAVMRSQLKRWRADSANSRWRTDVYTKIP